MNSAVIILALVTAQRLGELVLANRNTRRLLARGGTESGAGHYPLIVGLHLAWLAGLWFLAWDAAIQPAWAFVYLGLQALRAWILLSLGRRWTTRIITVPGETLVRRGPYRFARHPNYLLVAAEIAVLPLVFGLVLYSVLFFLVNAAPMWVRIRAEDRALLHAERP